MVKLLFTSLTPAATILAGQRYFAVPAAVGRPTPAMSPC
jgi:hypothetical protein